MPIRRTALCATALSITMSGALAGCSAEAEPTTEQRESERPIARSTPSAPATTPPATPEDTIRAWIESLVDMQNTGESEAFLSLSTPDCTYCTKFSAEVEAVYAAGGSASVPPTKIQKISPRGEIDGTEFAVLIDGGAMTMRPSASAEPQRFPGGPDTYLLQLTKRGGRWLVRRMERLSIP